MIQITERTFCRSDSFVDSGPVAPEVLAHLLERWGLVAQELEKLALTTPHPRQFAFLWDILVWGGGFRKNGNPRECGILQSPFIAAMPQISFRLKKVGITMRPVILKPLPRQVRYPAAIINEKIFGFNKLALPQEPEVLARDLLQSIGQKSRSFQSSVQAVTM